MMTLLEDFFDTLVPLSEGLESIFFARYKDVLRPKRLSETLFQMLVFFKGNQLFFLFTNLVACIICFENWICAVV